MRFSCWIFWAVFLFTTVPAPAATVTWTGGGTNDNWGTADNWGGTAPVANDLLAFDGANRLVNTNNLAAGVQFDALAFNSGAGAFTLRGNAIVLGGDLANQSTNTQTVSLAMALPDARTVDAAAGAITLGGALSGAGGINKTGPGALTLSGANSYAGAVAISNGTLKAGSGSALGAVAGGTTVRSGGTLGLNGQNLGSEPIVLIRRRPPWPHRRARSC